MRGLKQRPGLFLVLAAFSLLSAALPPSLSAGSPRIKFRTKTVGGIEFMRIPGGSFLMGSAEGEGWDSEHPRHRVKINGFWMGRYEVTFDQYEAVMGPFQGQVPGGNLPVHDVSWKDAKDFCAGFRAAHGIDVRLPTEAEWEYACRAGTRTKYHWGDTFDGIYCWHAGNSADRPHRGGTRLPNAWGLYDMAGNVWEWVEDWYDYTYYSVSPSDNPGGPSEPKSASVYGPHMGPSRGLRGGAWNDPDPDHFRSAFRSGTELDLNMMIGFRIVIPGE